MARRVEPYFGSVEAFHYRQEIIEDLRGRIELLETIPEAPDPPAEYP